MFSQKNKKQTKKKKKNKNKNKKERKWSIGQAYQKNWISFDSQIYVKKKFQSIHSTFVYDENLTKAKPFGPTPRG